MRIGLVSDCHHPTANGVTGAVSLLHTELLAHGHDVTLIVPSPPRPSGDTPAPPGPAGLPPSNSGVRVTPLSVPWFRSAGVRFALTTPGSVGRALGERDVEVVHTHTEGPLGLAARASARQLRIPAVHTLHTVYPHYLHYVMPSPLAGRHAQATLARLLGWYLGGFARVVAPSVRIRDLVTRLAPGVATRLVPNAVPAAPPAPSPEREADLRTRLGLPVGVGPIVAVGRVSAEKRSAALVAAFARLLQRRPDLMLVLAGPGRDRARLQARVAALGLAARILLPGRLSHAHVLELLAISSVCVSASLSENHPLSLLEASAAGVPLAVRRDAQLAAVAREDVNAVVADDDRALAAAAIALHDDPARRRRYAAAGRNLARAHHPSQHLEAILRVYREALADGHRPRVARSLPDSALTAAGGGGHRPSLFVRTIT
jgi:1,2-diacylglycerol 3-alpha-glucosyltransferase